MDFDNLSVIPPRCRCPLHPEVSMPRLEHVEGYQAPVLEAPAMVIILHDRRRDPRGRRFFLTSKRARG